MAPGYCATARGPLLEGAEACLTDGFPVTRLMLLEQAVGNQQLEPTHAHFDGRDHDNAP